MEKQFNALASKPDVIVATPGRLAHHLSEIPDFDLKACQIIVLDEADRLIEMGFASQIRQIASTLPQRTARNYC
jgi:ATP-dependent RNA helicase DDX54/DBP10